MTGHPFPKTIRLQRSVLGFSGSKLLDQSLHDLGFHVETNLGFGVERNAVAAAHVLENPFERLENATGKPREIFKERLGALRAGKQRQNGRAILGRQHQRLGRARSAEC